MPAKRKRKRIAPDGKDIKLIKYQNSTKEEKMNTLFDFTTYVKGIEYIIALMAIAGYIIYWEVLKPKPFRTLVENGKEDMEHIRKIGYKNTLKTAGKVLAAPFIGLAYVIALPFAFMFAIGSSAVNGALSLAGREAVFGWRPTETYLSGKKKGKQEKAETEAKSDEKEK